MRFPVSHLICAVSLLLVAGRSLPAYAGIPENVQREYSPDPASVIRFGPGWRYPQAGWHVVHIEGTPYERGFQHGHLLAAEIVDYIKALAEQRSHKAPKEAWRDMRLLSDSLFLRSYEPEFLEEMKGIADGAAEAGAKFDERRVDLLDIVALNCEIEVSFLQSALEASPTGVDSRKFAAPRYSQPRARHREHCSAFVATGPATADGKIVLGHITMSDLGYVRHYNVWLDIQPSEGHRVVFQTFPGGIQSGLDYYLCSSGLVISETTIEQTRFNREGKPLASRIRRAVQYADTIDDVVAILSDKGNGLYSNQWLLADTKTSEIAMFELGTSQSRLWRSSRNEWHDGTVGFYWGCNNVRDAEVFKETVPDLGGKPANLVRYPRTRDVAWLKLFEAHRGTIQEAFAFEAFTTPPLAAFPSCDAKFTTADSARKLESWALFGPPLGRTWNASAGDRREYPGVKPLVANDWTLLRPVPPEKTEVTSKAVDLAPFPDDDDDEEKASTKFAARHPFAWRGTLLPKSDADIWLAAGFAELEHVVAFENACRRESGESELSRSSRDLADLALFAHESRLHAANRRLGRDLPVRKIRADAASHTWYEVAVGKGVLILSALRQHMGKEAANQLFDSFGTAQAGKPVATEQFVAHCEAHAGTEAARKLRTWIDEGPPATPTTNIWTIYSFEAEPENALIVYGTLRDRAAQREAAEALQRAVARRFSNVFLPVRSDSEVSDEELKNHHLLIVGRPETNRIANRCRDSLPVVFGPASFTVRQATYAHPDSTIVAAGDNPLNPRYSAVIFAGLSAAATWKCVEHVDADDEDPPPQVLLSPAGRKPQRFRVTSSSTALARP